MNKAAMLTALAAVCLVGSGCIVRSDVSGALFLQQKGNAGVTNNAQSGGKKGRATATSILGLVGIGDASVKTAAANGGITKVSRVDYESMQILGIYGTYTVVVSGD